MYGINKNGLSIIGTPKSTGSVIPKMDGIRPIFPTDLKRLLFARNANINVKPNVHPIPPICATIPKVFAKICGSSCPAASAARFSELAAIVSGVKREVTVEPWIPQNINTVVKICISKYAGNDKDRKSVV